MQHAARLLNGIRLQANVRPAREGARNMPAVKTVRNHDCIAIDAAAVFASTGRSSAATWQSTYKKRLACHALAFELDFDSVAIERFCLI